MRDGLLKLEGVSKRFRRGATHDRLGELIVSGIRRLLHRPSRRPADDTFWALDDVSIEASPGEAVGLMFQIIDDLLDVTQSTEHTGKTTGKDLSAGKLTFPGVLGIDGSRAEVQRLQERAHGALAAFGPAAAGLRDLCDYMAVRTK